MTTEHWIILSNIALVIVTAAAVGVTLLSAVREGHRHEEETQAHDDASERRLATIVHEVLEQEKQEHASEAH